MKPLLFVLLLAIATRPNLAANNAVNGLLAGSHRLTQTLSHSQSQHPR